MPKPTGYILYRGPSQFDGRDIVAIATGFRGSANRKTGDMVQVWILDAGAHPIEANRSGADQSICGTCPHRGDYGMDGRLVPGSRSCYVSLVHGPASVWRTWQAGRYPDLTQADAATLAQVFSGLFVRLGAYGDPAAVPVAVWHAILTDAAGHTGYTHAWRQTRFAAFRDIVMASCDTSAERDAAKAMGWRTFRVAPRENWQAMTREVLCPASDEAGKKTTCAACKACGGTAAKARVDMFIPIHGTQASNAIRRNIIAQ